MPIIFTTEPLGCLIGAGAIRTRDEGGGLYLAVLVTDRRNASGAQPRVRRSRFRPGQVFRRVRPEPPQGEDAWRVQLIRLEGSRWTVRHPRKAAKYKYTTLTESSLARDYVRETSAWDGGTDA